MLKAIGFTRSLVLQMVLGESILISLSGGVLGVVMGRLLWSAAHLYWPQYVPVDLMAPIILLQGVALSAAIGLVSGLVPALRASAVSVVTGLRKIV
jgi:putative ABC transport system permease protein